MREGLGAVPSNFTVPLMEALASGGADQPERIHMKSPKTQIVHAEMNDDLDLISSLPSQSRKICR
jgi:hypothetical protein